jgi:uncharacterized Tic20 family protein
MAEIEEVPEPAEKPKDEGVEQPQDVQIGPPGKESNKDARMWAMFCHLAGLCALLPIVPIIGGVLGPLVLWQVKKEEFDFVNDQGKEAVNFQISILLYSLIGSIVCGITCVGIPLIPFVLGIIGILDIVFLIIASIKANDGERYRYPLTIRFIK